MAEDKDIDDSFDEPLVADAGGADEEYYDDGDDFSGEEGDDWDSGSPEDPAAALTKKKKSKDFNRKVIAGALAIGFVVVYMQLKGGGPASQTAPTPPPSAETAATPPQEQQAVAQAPPSQRDIFSGKNRKEQVADLPDQSQGFLSNPDTLVKVDDLKNRVVFGEEEEAPPDDTQQPREVSQSPPMPAPITQQEEPAVPAPATSAQSPPGYEKEIMDKLDALSSRLDGIEDRIEAVSASAAAKSDIALLENGLQGRIRTELQTLIEEQKAAQPKTAQKPAHTAKKRTGTNTAGKSSVKKPQPAAPAWVLRSARPGQALVSRAGEAETRAIAIGDSLPGIGKVTAVFADRGLWVVQGTDGRIFQ